MVNDIGEIVYGIVYLSADSTERSRLHYHIMKHATDEAYQKRGIRLVHQDWRGNLLVIGPEKEEETLKQIVDDITSQIKKGLYEVIRGTRVIEKRKNVRGDGVAIAERQYIPAENKPITYWSEKIRDFLSSSKNIKNYHLYEQYSLSEGLERQAIAATLDSPDGAVEIYIILEAVRKDEKWQNLTVRLDGGQQTQEVQNTVSLFWRELMTAIHTPI